MIHGSNFAIFECSDFASSAVNIFSEYSWKYKKKHGFIEKSKRFSILIFLGISFQWFSKRFSAYSFLFRIFFRTFRNVCARHYNRIFNAKHLRIWHYLCVYEFRQHIQWKFFHGIPMKVFLFVFGQLHMWSVLIETVYFANFYCFYSNGIYVNTIFINGCSISHSNKTCNEMELIL